MVSAHRAGVSGLIWLTHDPRAFPESPRVGVYGPCCRSEHRGIVGEPRRSRSGLVCSPTARNVANGTIDRARAVVSTHVKTAERGLRIYTYESVFAHVRELRSAQDCKDNPTNTHEL